MKRIKDERLILVTLKNIRIAFATQTLGILAILIYTAVSSGPDAAFASPLNFVMLLSNILLLVLQLNVSADVEETDKKQRKGLPFYAILLIPAGIGILMGLITFLSDRQHPVSSLIIGAVFFICFLASFSLMYYLRKKRKNDDGD
ncbi:branched-chain amino acid ABC transporter substrate-binding protein [Sporolactobacillus sp. Y61]|uniref:Branched-chain amino acid ABC transporter substrate-binding protein n=1 Tax=Sporolactobacillus sp. Y61 TaxID=3160863 RepID=A0AAU8IH07_9BACL